MVREVIDATGAVRGRQRRASDSTILDDAVARQDTVTQLIAQVRRVGREVLGAPAVIIEQCTGLATLTGQGYDTPGKPRIAWDDTQARDELVSVLVTDALALLDGLDVAAITAAAGNRPKRSPCSPSSPGRMWNRPRVPTVAMSRTVASPTTAPPAAEADVS